MRRQNDGWSYLIICLPLMMASLFGCGEVENDGNESRDAEIASSIAELKEAVAQLTQQLRKLEAGSTPSPFRVEERRATNPSSDSEISDAMGRIETQLTTFIRDITDQSGIPGSVDQTELRAAAGGRETDWEAVGEVIAEVQQDKTCQGLLFLSMTDIMNKLGKPTSIQPQDVNRVYWTYGDEKFRKPLHISFLDGTVYLVLYDPRR